MTFFIPYIKTLSFCLKNLLNSHLGGKYKYENLDLFIFQFKRDKVAI